MCTFNPAAPPSTCYQWYSSTDHLDERQRKTEERRRQILEAAEKGTIAEKFVDPADSQIIIILKYFSLIQGH